MTRVTWEFPSQTLRFKTGGLIWDMISCLSIWFISMEHEIWIHKWLRAWIWELDLPERKWLGTCLRPRPNDLSHVYSYWDSIDLSCFITPTWLLNVSYFFNHGCKRCCWTASTLMLETGNWKAKTGLGMLSLKLWYK